MAQLLERVDTVELLSNLYKNVRMAADSISAILPHVEDERLMSDLTVELSCFEEYAHRALRELEARDASPTASPTTAPRGSAEVPSNAMPKNTTSASSCPTADAVSTPT